jgi:hypothetical protein
MAPKKAGQLKRAAADVGPLKEDIAFILVVRRTYCKISLARFINECGIAYVQDDAVFTGCQFGG